MIKVEKVKVMNIENAIRGMRNAKNSWDKSDSAYCWESYPDCENCPQKIPCERNYLAEDGAFAIGENDLKLAKALVKAGSDERKFLRQIFVTFDITAPRFWWTEMDTYKISTVSNSTSTMHKLVDSEITKADFSFSNPNDYYEAEAFHDLQNYVIYNCEWLRNKYNETKDKKYWRMLVEILPQSFNQMRTWTANYEVLRNIYKARKNHKLDEWREFCKFLETLPYAKEFIFN